MMIPAVTGTTTSTSPKRRVVLAISLVVLLWLAGFVAHCCTGSSTTAMVRSPAPTTAPTPHHLMEYGFAGGSGTPMSVES